MPNIVTTPTSYGADLENMVNEANLYTVLSMENAIQREGPRIAWGDEPKLDRWGNPKLDNHGNIQKFARGDIMFQPTGELDADGDDIMRAETTLLISGTIPGLHPDYMNLANYRRVLTGEGTDARVAYTFPHGATRYHPHMHEPNVIYQMRLFSTPASQEWRIDLTPEQQRRKILADIGKACKNMVNVEASFVTDIDDLDRIKQQSEAELKGKSPAEKRELRESDMYMDRFLSIASPAADKSPIYKAAFAFHTLKQQQARKNHGHFSAMDLSIKTVDPKLSPFGNSQVTFGLQCEFLKDITTVHQEMFMARKIATAAMEVHRGLK
jgi:hypothetical protein